MAAITSSVSVPVSQGDGATCGFLLNSEMQLHVQLASPDGGLKLLSQSAVRSGLQLGPPCS
eukprot:568489-Pyramimonas_sp.AAC.1